MSDSLQVLRQWKLLQRLSDEQDGVLLTQLAAELGVSPRTVRRDLGVLQAADFPLEEHVGVRGVKRWRMQPLGPQLQVGYADLISVMMSRRLLEPMAGTPLWDGQQRLLRKVRGVLGERAVRYCQQLSGMLASSGFGVSDYTRRGELLDALLLGMEERRWVRVQYQGGAGETSAPRAASGAAGQWQQLGPLGLIWHNGSLYLIAWSQKRGEVRNYKVDRVLSAEAEGGASDQFEIPSGFSLQSWQETAFGVYRGSGARMWEIRVRFRAGSARYVQESWWHGTQRFVELPDGGVELHLRLNELTAVSKWILGFGSSATVLAPAELQQLIREEATALLRDLEDLDRQGE